MSTKKSYRKVCKGHEKILTKIEKVHKYFSMFSFTQKKNAN